jgi:cytochrome c oxidase subunit 2
VLDWLPPQASSFAADIDNIFAIIYYVVGVWFIALHALLLYMLVAFRKKKGVSASYLVGNTLRQMSWILVPCVLVLILDFWIDHRGAQVWALVKEDVPEADMNVVVTGMQFNWEIVYEGPDASLGTDDDYKAENTLHVPVDKDIVLALKSKDVLHSFFVPEFRLKQDAVPGRTIYVWFRATVPGKYEIGCAELCGFGHTGMRGLLTVHSPESWDAWVAKRWPEPVVEALESIEASQPGESS